MMDSNLEFCKTIRTKLGETRYVELVSYLKSHEDVHIQLLLDWAKQRFPDIPSEDLAVFIMTPESWMSDGSI